MSMTPSDPRAEPGADEADALVTIEVEGDGFLYNMVRSIAGTLVEVGRGKRDPTWIAEVLAARDRTPPAKRRRRTGSRCCGSRTDAARGASVSRSARSD